MIQVTLYVVFIRIIVRPSWCAFVQGAAVLSNEWNIKAIQKHYAMRILLGKIRYSPHCQIRPININY